MEGKKAKEVRIYTSYYAKMAKRRKGVDDVYVAVSRTFYCPLRDLGGKVVGGSIDSHFPMVGCDVEYDEYKGAVDREEVGLLAEYLNPDDWEAEGEEGIVRIFLLCFENLESRYTKRDEERFSDVKAGELKKCHRTLLAEILRDEFGIGSEEYSGDDT